MSAKGMIVLMGSGELTATMVELHKELMRRSAAAGPAVFLDTPAGFQLNADQISAKAVAYFRTRVGHTLATASYKVRVNGASLEAEKAFRALTQAGYILIGPGSPTYAVRQWQETPIPETLTQRVAAGGCLVAASAAALTVGRFTLPVYEIYKVGEGLRWEPG
ncbi:MAG: cysteinyl-tRNA synthetase, partial [Desulfobacteraceae bacterium]